MKVLIIIAILFSFTLFSCNGVDGNLIEKGPSPDYLGLCSEAQWVYRAEQDLGFGESTWTETMMVVDILEENGGSIFYVDLKRDGELENSILFKEEDGEYFFFGRFEYEEEDRVEYPKEDPILLLEKPLDNSATLFTINGETLELEVERRVKIDVQAGYYRAYHLRGEKEYVIGRTVAQYWFVPHLGVIRMIEEYQEEMEEGWATLEKTEFELISYVIYEEGETKE